MDLQQLRYFSSAARLQHMTRAAEEQGVAQPSLSKSIRLLESELKTELFERKGRGVRLSDAGRAFLPHVETALRALADGRREMEDRVGSRQEELAISAVALLWATDLFRVFAERRPDLRFRLFQRTPEEMVRQLARREVDLCLMTDPGMETVEWIPLVSGEVYVLVCAGHRYAGRREISIEALRDEPLIVPRAGGPLRELIDTAFREAGHEPNVVCESDDVAAMRELAQSGLGLQFLPDLRGTLGAGAPTCLRLIDPVRSVQVGIARSAETYHSRAAHDFVSFARRFVAERESVTR